MYKSIVILCIIIVPQEYKFTLENGSIVSLGKWLSAKRQKKKLGRLLPEREAALQALVDAGKLKWSLPAAYTHGNYKSNCSLILIKI